MKFNKSMMYMTLSTITNAWDNMGFYYFILGLPFLFVYVAIGIIVSIPVDMFFASKEVLESS